MRQLTLTEAQALALQKAILAHIKQMNETLDSDFVTGAMKQQINQDIEHLGRLLDLLKHTLKGES